MSALLLTSSLACAQNADDTSYAVDAPKPGQIVAQAETGASKKEIDDDTAKEMETLSVYISDYEDGTVNGRKSYITYENTEFDGKRVLKIIPDPTCTETKTLSVDAYHYLSAEINLSLYKYASMEYYYESENPGSYTPVLGFMRSSGYLTASTYADAEETMIAGKWATAMFDLSACHEALNPDAKDCFVRQIHIYPFGSNTLSKLSAEDTI